jgi:hypothetical protein
VENGREPIADDELLYRRVPASMDWYDPTTKLLEPEGFGPNKKRDVSGLSVSRGKYKTIEEAGRGQPGKLYYVAVLLAAEVRSAGMSIEPRPDLPDGYDASHAELPDLNAANYKESITLERQRVLAKLCRSVEGPFETPRN